MKNLNDLQEITYHKRRHDLILFVEHNGVVCRLVASQINNRERIASLLELRLLFL